MASTQDTNNYSATTTRVRENNNNNNNKEVEVLNKTRTKCFDLVLRVLALVLTLVAAILVGVDTQTKVVQVRISDNIPPLNVPVHAKWNYLSAFVYLVATNSIACGYAAISLALSLASAKCGKKGLALVIAALDLVVVALLFSGIGAAGAVGLIGYNGNSHLQWNKVCNVFGRFCHQLTVALVLSFIGGLGFFLLVLLSLFKVQKKN